MDQGNLIVAALLLLFFVFVTVRGELPTYLSLIL